MERFQTIIEIISIQPIASEKEIRKRITAFPAFEHFIFPQLTKAQLKQAKKTTNIVRITELFDLINFSIELHPELLINLTAVYQQISKDHVLVHYLSLFTLFQYIGFVIQLETTFNISSVVLLFQSLSMFSELKFQPVIISAINDVLSIIIDNYSHDLFSQLFDPLSAFLLSNPSINESILSFLPMLLKRVIDDSESSAGSDASKLSSLISLLFSNLSISISQPTITFFFEIIRPHLFLMNEFAFIIMQSITKYLDVDQLNSFFIELPSKIFHIIEKNGTPFIKPPDPIEYEAFTPTTNPECHFRFPEVMTFVDGFDASSHLFLPSPSIVGLCNPEFYSLIRIIVQVIGNSDDVAQLFLDTLTEYVDNKSNTEFRYDYLGILVLFWERLTDKLPIERLRFPKILFEPTISVFEPNFDLAGVFFSIRFYSISSLLKVAEPDLHSFLLDNVKYPRLFSEIFEICNLNLDKVSNLIMKQSSMIRTIRLIGLQLQTAQFNKEISTECIELARTSLFRLLFRIFVNNYFVYCFLNDVLFLSFFVSLLFEEGIRSFILTQLKIYIERDLDNSQCELFMNQLCQVIDQANNILPSQAGLLLISDVLSSFKTKSEVKLVLCDVLRNSLLCLDNSSLSRRVLYQIIRFFTMISKTTSKLPQECLTDLEMPLKRFDDLTRDDFNLMLCLLASDYLDDYQSTFSIKNGLLLSVMFHVFYKPKRNNAVNQASNDIDIVNYSLQICKYSIQNCIVCHKSGFDLTLLDFLIENRESDDGNIPTILTIITKIASVVSSPIVVQKFISLFIPIESRYISRIHSHLLKPLLQILREARNYPSLTFLLNHSRVLQSVVNNKQLLEHDGFSFVFWLYYDTGEITHIFSLFNNEDKGFFSITMDNDIILINGQSTYIHIPNKQWCFLAFTYQIESCIATFFVESEEVWRETNIIIKIPIGQISCRIGPEHKN